MNAAQASSSSSSSAGKPDRLFVGNLAPTVDEYTLVQVFSAHGKITKLDLMVHKSGPLKGKPRGYAFVEYSNKDDALKALVKLHDRLLRGRKLVVTFASSAPMDDMSMYPKGRRIGEAAKPTTLSLIKSSRRPQSAAAQIAAMEAKLATMSKRRGRSPTPEPGPDSEEVLGVDEGRRAAEDLEREMNMELGDGLGSTKELAASVEAVDTSTTDTTTREANHEDDQVHPNPTTDSATTPTTEPTSEPARLAPSKPAGNSSSHPSLPLPPPPPPPPPREDSRARARQEAFQRGLASLPKRPAF